MLCHSDRTSFRWSFLTSFGIKVVTFFVNLTVYIRFCKKLSRFNRSKNEKGTCKSACCKSNFYCRRNQCWRFSMLNSFKYRRYRAFVRTESECYVCPTNAAESEREFAKVRQLWFGCRRFSAKLRRHRFFPNFPYEQ